MKPLICIILIAGMMACKNNQKDRDSISIAKEANRDKADKGSNIPMNKDTVAATMAVEKADANFAVEAANGNMTEVQLGELAKTKAVNSRVKKFGSMMITDHMELNEHLQKIARTKNISLPQALSDDAKKDIDNLNKKTGRDFDRAYMHMMLTDHKKDVSEFEKAAKDCKDPELKNFIEKALPVMMKHLDSAKAIDKLYVEKSPTPEPIYP